MSHPLIGRRVALRLSVGLAACAAAPRSVWAADGALAATTFPGAWEEAHRRFLLPAFRNATGVAATLTASQAVDTVTKLVAAQASPPFDVVMMDEGPFLQGVTLDLFRPLIAEAMPNLASLSERAQRADGLGAYVSAQVFGIAYDTERVRAPPAGWEELTRPEYRGRVGLVGLNSTLGTVWMVALAKMLGGDEDHMDPAFDFVARLLPNVGAVASNPGALGTLFQTGQIDVACHYLNNVEALKAKDVPLALARPSSGWGLVRSLMCLSRNTTAAELGSRYVDAALSPAVQGGLAGAPYFIAPTNTRVPFGSALAVIAPDASAMDSFVKTDWTKINPRRAEYIDRFNRLVKR